MSIGRAGSGAVPAAQNMLLASWPVPLPAEVQLVDLEQGQVIQDPGAEVETVFFPVTALLALAVEAAGTTEPVEVHHLGREGVAGACVIAGEQTSRPRITCAVPGAVWALPAEELIAAAGADDAVTRLVQRYVLALTGHLAQRVACTSTHTTKQRFAAAVLTTAWQTGGTDTVALTQADLARMLLVRRATVSAAATRLADTGAIRYRYGTITIADPGALEDAACGCHRSNRQSYLAIG